MTIPAACGSDKPFAFPTVSSSDIGSDPTVVSAGKAPKETMVSVLKEGTGHPVAAHDVLVANATGQVWSNGGVAPTPFLDTFSSKHLLVAPIDGTVPGWAKALPGVKVGSRILMVNPPADGFGAQGNPQIKVTKTDSLVWVIDVVDSMPADAVATGKPAKAPADAATLPTVSAGKNPTVTVPKVAAPKKLVAEPLLIGTGPKIAEGEMVLAQYTGVIWADNRVFDSSWSANRGPFSARIADSDPASGEGGVIKGWVQGIAGQRVGSRVLLIVPPKLGYGTAGSSGAGIKGTDTLVFVVDILGVYGDPTKGLFTGVGS
jgi:peptidylprolyl isomerase